MKVHSTKKVIKKTMRGSKVLAKKVVKKVVKEKLDYSPKMLKKQKLALEMTRIPISEESHKMLSSMLEDYKFAFKLRLDGLVGLVFKESNKEWYGCYGWTVECFRLWELPKDCRERPDMGCLMPKTEKYANQYYTSRVPDSIYGHPNINVAIMNTYMYILGNFQVIPNSDFTDPFWSNLT